MGCSTVRQRLLQSLCALAIAASLAAEARGQAPAAPNPAPSHTGQAADEPPGYGEAIDEALREFDAQHYEEARSLFARAHALYPNARTERGLGLAQFELRNYGESIHHFEAALRSEVKPLTPELRRDTEDMLARANGFIARVQLDIRGASDATLVLDGVHLEPPLGGVLLLQVGDHLLEVSAQGFARERRKISVQAGGEQNVKIVLSPSASSSATRPPEKVWYKSPWLWTGVGVVLVGAAAGTGYALARPDSKPRAYGGTADALFIGP